MAPVELPTRAWSAPTTELGRLLVGYEALRWRTIGLQGSVPLSLFGRISPVVVEANALLCRAFPVAPHLVPTPSVSIQHCYLQHYHSSSNIGAVAEILPSSARLHSADSGADERPSVLRSDG